MKNLILFLFPAIIFAQGENCNYYKMQGDSLNYKACDALEKLNSTYYQFSKEYMQVCDAIIKFNPKYAPAYREKSVAYVKSGDFVEWFKIVNDAVKYDPEGYLGIRAGLKAKFFADYEGAIRDIDSLASITKFDLGHTHNGDYHLNFVKGISYSQLGKKEKAIEIFEKQLAQQDHIMGLYDFYQLGVTYFEIQNFKKAIEILTKQLTENENAETHYFLGQSYKLQNQTEKYTEHKEKALELYRKGVIMRDPYHEHINKVYLETILID